MKRSFLILGLILLVFAAAWYFALRNNFNRRFPDGWSWTINSIGHGSFTDESGAFPENTGTADDPIAISARTVTASSANAPAGQVHIVDHFETYDPVTNAVTWELTLEANVDPVTGQHTEGELAGDYYFLPQNVSKDQTYTISNTSYRSLELVFQNEEVISGINTYLFAYYGDFNNEAAYPDYALEENQAIICFNVELEFWVEPVTGEIVKYREWCEGDYVVNTETNERVTAIQRWGTESDSADLVRQASVVNTALVRYQAVNLYIPLIAAILGAILLAVGVFLQEKADSSNEKKVAA
jgi:hypothetical protein